MRMATFPFLAFSIRIWYIKRIIRKGGRGDDIREESVGKILQSGVLWKGECYYQEL